jgi:hypothetical protein
MSPTVPPRPNRSQPNTGARRPWGDGGTGETPTPYARTRKSVLTRGARTRVTRAYKAGGATGVSPVPRSPREGVHGYGVARWPHGYPRPAQERRTPRAARGGTLARL